MKSADGQQIVESSLSEVPYDSSCFACRKDDLLTVRSSLKRSLIFLCDRHWNRHAVTAYCCRCKKLWDLSRAELIYLRSVEKTVGAGTVLIYPTGCLCTQEANYEVLLIQFFAEPSATQLPN